tara:strand:- start:38 stop:283 length:246 start_codon:yes stop_codon:yes gene_type:complete
MNIDKFHKCFDLWLADNSSSNVKGMIISDKEFNGQITETTFENNTEWRDSNGEPIEKSAEITWSALSSYEAQAEEVADYSN